MYKFLFVVLLIPSIVRAEFTMEDYLNKKKAAEVKKNSNDASFTQDSYNKAKKHEKTNLPQVFQKVESQEVDYAKGIRNKEISIAAMQHKIKMHQKKIEEFDSEGRTVSLSIYALQKKIAVHKSKRDFFRSRMQHDHRKSIADSLKHHSTHLKKYTREIAKYTAKNDRNLREKSLLQVSIARMEKQIEVAQKRIVSYKSKLDKQEQTKDDQSSLGKAVSKVSQKDIRKDSKSLTTQLATLKALFDSNLITEIEYKEKKTELLKRL